MLQPVCNSYLHDSTVCMQHATGKALAMSVMHPCRHCCVAMCMQLHAATCMAMQQACCTCTQQLTHADRLYRWRPNSRNVELVSHVHARPGLNVKLSEHRFIKCKPRTTTYPPVKGSVKPDSIAASRNTGTPAEDSAGAGINVSVPLERFPTGHKLVFAYAKLIFWIK